MMVQHSAPIVAPPPGGLTHGLAFTIAGSGFGTKVLTAPFWDNCTGTNPLNIWSKAYPNANPTNSGYNLGYHATPFTRSLGTGAVAINHPNSRGTGVLAGCSQSQSLSNLWNVGVSASFSAPTVPFTIFQSWWTIMDSQWSPNSNGTDSNENWKYCGYGFGGDIFGSDSHGAAYLYCDYQQNINFTSPSYEENDDSTRMVTNPNNSAATNHIWGSGGGQDLHSWLRRTCYMNFNGSAPSYLRIYENDAMTTDKMAGNPASGGTSSNLILTDGLDAGSRSAWMLIYPRYSSNNNWMYYADVYQDIGDAQFWISTSATWGSGTVAVQPWTSWSNSSVTFTANGDRIPTGSTVYIHFRLGPWNGSGHQVFGPYTLNG